MAVLSLTPLFPELVMVLAALGLLLLGAFQGEGASRGLMDGGAFVLLLAFLTLVALLYGVPEGLPPLQAGFVLDPLAGVFKALILAAGFVCLLMSRAWLVRERVARTELPALWLLAMTGMMIFLSATNFLVLYMGMELQSLALYVLAAFDRKDQRSAEAGVKYFVLGSLASGFFLYGVSLVYGTTGSIDLAAVATLLGGGSAPQPGLLIGVVFILVALLFKMAIAPFHMWAPDVYEGAPTPVTAFFSVVPKIAVVGLLVRLLGQPLAPMGIQVQLFLAGAAALTLGVAALGGMGQKNIKRLLAYSAMGHAGFVLAGLSVGTGAGFTAAFTYLAFYAVMSLGAFAVLLCLRQRGQRVEKIADLAGLSHHHPGLAAAFAIFLFSMMGLPPLVGFFTKLYVLLALLKGHLVWLAVVAALSSVASAYYYLMVIKVMYVDKASAGPLDQPLDPAPAVVAVVMAVLTVAGLGLMEPVSSLSAYALQGLMLVEHSQ